VATLNRRNTLKLFASIGAAGAASPLLAACTSSDGSGVDDGRPVRIALVVPQSGALQPMGDEMTAGFNLFLSQNANVLGGRKVSHSIHDEGATASSGLDAVNAILKQGVDVLVGVANSAVMSAIRDTVEKAEVPLIGTSGSPTNLLSPKYIWRASYVSGDAGGVLGTYFNENNRKHIFVYDDGTPDGAAEAAACRTAFTGTVTSASGAITSAISKINSSGASVVVACASGSHAVDFIKQYSGSVNKPLYGPGFLTEGYVLKPEGAAARNVYTVLNYSYDLDNDANRAFASAYFNADANDEVPSTYAMATYDALNILDRAIRDINGAVTPLAINAALGRVGQFDSPRGPWQFDQNRTPQQTWYLRQVRPDGRVWLNTVLQRVIAPVQSA
jgi:branched-chain amino acid transport system substrate-binding protein